MSSASLERLPEMMLRNKSELVTTTSEMFLFCNYKKYKGVQQGCCHGQHQKWERKTQKEAKKTIRNKESSKPSLSQSASFLEQPHTLPGKFVHWCVPLCSFPSSVHVCTVSQVTNKHSKDEVGWADQRHSFSQNDTLKTAALPLLNRPLTATQLLT